MISFVFFPGALEPSMNCNISITFLLIFTPRHYSYNPFLKCNFNSEALCIVLGLCVGATLSVEVY